MRLNALPEESMRGHVALFHLGNIAIIQESKSVLTDTLFFLPHSLCDVKYTTYKYNFTIILRHLDPGNHRFDVVILRMRRIYREVDRSYLASVKLDIGLTEKVFTVSDVTLIQYDIVCI